MPVYKESAGIPNTLVDWRTSSEDDFSEKEREKRVSSLKKRVAKTFEMKRMWLQIKKNALSDCWEFEEWNG